MAATSDRTPPIVNLLMAARRVAQESSEGNALFKRVVTQLMPNHSDQQGYFPLGHQSPAKSRACPSPRRKAHKSDTWLDFVSWSWHTRHVINLQAPEGSDWWFTIGFFLFGQLPMGIWFLSSLPWGLRFKGSESALVSESDSSLLPPEPNQCLSWLEERNHSMRVAIGAIINWMFVFAYFLIVGSFRSWVCVFVYMLSLNLLCLTKECLRREYCLACVDTKPVEFDNSLFGAFGITVFVRGRAFVYAYPLIATLPTVLIYVTLVWFTQSRFPMECPPSVKNGTQALGNCSPDVHFYDMTYAIPFFLSHSLAMYRVIKFLASKLVEWDPETEASNKENQGSPNTKENQGSLEQGDPETDASNKEKKENLADLGSGQTLLGRERLNTQKTSKNVRFEATSHCEANSV